MKINKLDTIVDKMVEENDISNIVNYRRAGRDIIFDEDGLIKYLDSIPYPVSSRVFLEDFLEISKIILYLSDFLIGEENIIMDVDQIYRDEEGQIRLKIVPMDLKGNDIRDLYFSFLEKLIFDDPDKCGDLLVLLNYFNTGNYSLQGLIERLDKKDELGKDYIKKEDPPSRFKALRDLFVRDEKFDKKDLDMDFKIPGKD